MASTSLALTKSSYPTEQKGLMHRLLSAIIQAREAQVASRMESQLRDHLPEKVLRDIGKARR